MLAHKATENEIKNAILEWLDYQKDIYFFRAGSGAIKTADGRYFRSGKSGCPDIVCVYKGKFIGIETKSIRGRQSLEQKQAQEEIVKAGGYYILARSTYDVENCLKLFELE